MRASLLLALLLLPNSGPAAELVAVPARPSPRIEAEARELLRSRWAVRAVFSAGEARALEALGERELGHSLRISLLDGEEAAFRAWAARHAPSFRIENNPRVKLAAADPLRARQWGLDNRGGSYSVDIDDFTRRNLPAVAGEDIGLRGAPQPVRPVTVAVLDSGLDLSHPDLAKAIARHEAECAPLAAYRACVARSGAAKCEASLVDHDGNGYPLDCQGWNLVGKGALPRTAGIVGDPMVTDESGHGTHVAGIIAAQVNGAGTEGVAPMVRILPVKVISGEPNEAIRVQQAGLPEPAEGGLKGGTGLGDSVARGILYALRSNAQVINMSLGWPDPFDSKLVRRMVELARARGVLLVAAAGNDSTDSVILPCRYDGVICVGAHGPDGAVTFFSNFGYGVDVLAPGWNILSTFPLSRLPVQFTGQVGYEAKDGSSMAAPFVSGLLARLLGSGQGPGEAFSRMMLGARATRDSQLEDPAIFGRSSIAGNADLAASYRVAPQALILPARKEPSRAEWDGIAKSVPVRFELVSHWLEGRNVEVEIEALGGFVRAVRGRWSVPSWPAGETRSFATDLEILDTRLASDLEFELRVRAGNSAPRSFRMRAVVVVPMGPRSPLREGARRLPLVSAQGQALERSYDEVLTVVTESDEEAEYLGVLQQNGQRTLELIAEVGGQMRVRGALTAPAGQLTVSSLRKIHDPATGKARYALVESVPAPQGPVRRASASQFTFLDDTFRQLGAPQTVDPAATFLSEDFQWQKLGGKLVPTWYAVGTVPAEERKKYNPWKPKENTGYDFRVYYLADGGLRSLALPKQYPLMVSLVPQTLKQKREGTVSILVAKGEDYALEYGLVQLREGKFSEVRAIRLPVYHNLRGLVAAKVLSLEPGEDFAGAAFSGYVNSTAGPNGGRRTSVIGTRGMADLNATTIRRFDTVTDAPGTFTGAKRVAQFSLTKYDVQYHDHTLRESRRASQKRFSFLPTVFALKSFFPLVAEDSRLAERLPGLFTPGDFAFSKATQLLLPRYSSSGRLEALERPALFHIETKEGCTALPSARAATRDAPSQLLFFCGNHFTAVPVRY